MYSDVYLYLLGFDSRLYVLKLMYVLQGLLDCNAAPVGLAGIILHLHYHEPGNFAFVSCIYEGLLQKICLDPDARNSENKFNEVTMRKLALVTCYFFTNRGIHSSQRPKEESINHVILPPLPDEFQEVRLIIQQYSEIVALHGSYLMLTR